MKSIDFLKSQSQQFSNRRKLSANKRLKQKSQHRRRKKFKFLNKEHIREMQYISPTIATKLNNARTMFYHTS